METDDAHKAQREKEMQNISELANLHFVQHGSFPTKIRVGASIGQRLFPPGAIRATTPDFTVELDRTLDLEQVEIDA